MATSRGGLALHSRLKVVRKRAAPPSCRRNEGRTRDATIVSPLLAKLERPSRRLGRDVGDRIPRTRGLVPADLARAGIACSRAGAGRRLPLAAQSGHTVALGA